MSSAAKKYKVLTDFCEGRTCDLCAMNRPTLACIDDGDLCVVALAMERLKECLEMES